jgi:small nuclear ribonucleoprotein (snRNP)-like protein
MNHQRGVAANSVIWALAGILVIIAAGFHITRSMRHPSVKFDTAYQAVLLANGSVYFGHLQNFEGHHPVLTDVFYIVSQTDPATKQVNNVLVKRGKELHAPDRMYLNPSQIVFVEPVGAESKVAQLIAQASH